MKLQNNPTDSFIAWANAQPLVRALLLTSSQANPDAPVDRLSDHDVIIVVADTHPFVTDEGWVRAYDTPLVCFRDSHVLEGERTYARLVLYADGTKIDYTLWPVALLAKVAAAPQLPDALDVGYRVLLDKDGLAHHLIPPTYRAHIPSKPSEAEYLALVEEFWWETTYVAKNLWRDELFPAKYSFDAVIKFDLLRRMLEWYIEIDHDWSLKPGNLGRGLKKYLSPDLWVQVETTFVGPNVEENWEALFRTAALFRTIACAVATRLGYAYPLDLDRRTLRYLSHIKQLEP
ncbi:MAG: aminoglycoside 6-adenylyltransferase [Chloroflexota bacterium]|nr:aminoglycoside 6-adenylyltransferase [Chloroflexota bacterium]